MDLAAAGEGVRNAFGAIPGWIGESFLIAWATFIGAVGAFLLERWGKVRSERQREASAGNSTLFILVDQFNFLRSLNDQYLAEHVDDPLRWIRVPAIADYPAYLRIDSADLRFLVRGTDANLLLGLQQAQRYTDSVAQTLQDRSAFHLAEVQPRVERLQQAVPADEQLPITEIEKALGTRVLATLRQYTDHLYDAWGEAFRLNQEVFTQLRNHLKKEYPKAAIIDRTTVGGDASTGR